MEEAVCGRHREEDGGQESSYGHMYLSWICLGAMGWTETLTSCKNGQTG